MRSKVEQIDNEIEVMHKEMNDAEINEKNSDSDSDDSESRSYNSVTED